MSGAIGLAAAALLAAYLRHGGIAREWRLAVFPLVFFGLLGFMQAKAGT